MALLEGFLVRLGFEVDEDSASKMKDTARKAGEAVASIGKKAAGMGIALGAAVLKASSDLSKMYMTASRSGTSVGNIRAMGYALSQVGGDSEQAMQSIGVLVNRVDRHTVQINGGQIHDLVIEDDYIKKIRASYYLLGALLGKYRKAENKYK